MYKKLANSIFIFLFVVTTITVAISASFQATFNGFSAFISVSDLINSYTSDVIMFDVVENSSINTEILARRIGSGLATAGLGGVGTGIGLVFSGLIKGFSRNPSLKDDLFSYAIFGFALTEAIGLFALMMAFMLLYA